MKYNLDGTATASSNAGCVTLPDDLPSDVTCEFCKPFRTLDISHSRSNL
jgi:hypothetical protein